MVDFNRTMTQRKVQQVLRRLAEATPSGKLPSERESEAFRLATAVGGVVGKMAGAWVTHGPRGSTDSHPAVKKEGASVYGLKGEVVRRQHVIPHADGWAVKQESTDDLVFRDECIAETVVAVSDRRAAVFATREEAINHALTIASEGREVIVHGKAGVVRSDGARK